MPEAPSFQAPTVSVVITNFNGEHYLPGMKKAIEKTGYRFSEIIVSDDCSTDGSRLFVRHQWPEARLISSNRNRGPSPTRNAGINAATAELILLLDNDGYPFADAVPPLVNRLRENPELAGVMPRIILRGNPAMVHCDGSRTHITGQMWLLNGHVPVDDAKAISEPIASLMGTAMMFRRDGALRIGGFEEDYFFYYEDHDFGTRQRILNGPLVSVPEARIDHLTGTAGLSFRVGKRYPLKRAYLTAKNRWLFGIRTLKGRTLLLLSPILLIHEFAQLAYVLRSGWFEAYFQGLRWNLTHLARTLRKREWIQRRRVAQDLEILEPGEIPLHPGLRPKSGATKALLALLERGFNAWFRLIRRFLR